MEGEIIRAIAARQTRVAAGNAVTAVAATTGIEATGIGASVARAGIAMRAAAGWKAAVRVVAREAARATVPRTAVQIAKDHAARAGRIKAHALSKAAGWTQTSVRTRVHVESRTAPTKVAVSMRVLAQIRTAGPRVDDSSQALAPINLAGPKRASSAMTSATAPKRAQRDRTSAETDPEVGTARIAVANVVADGDAAGAEEAVAAGAKVAIARVVHKAEPRWIPALRAVGQRAGRRTRLLRRLHLSHRPTVVIIASRPANRVSRSRSFGLHRRHRGWKSRARPRNT